MFCCNVLCPICFNICLQCCTSYISEQGSGGFSKALSVLFFLVVLTMDGKNHVYIDLTVDINGCSYGSHNAPQTHDDSHTTRTCRPGQRHAHGSSNVDLTMEAKTDPQDPPYNPDREQILLEEMRGVLQNPPPGPFKKEDILWRPILSQGCGHRRLNDVAVIPWERLQDFVDGENNNPEFPCRFTKEMLKKNPLGSVKLVRPNTCSVQIKYLSRTELLDLPLG